MHCFFPPSAVCRCRGRIRTYQWKSSSRQLPESDRNPGLGTFSISDKTPHCKISWSLEAARLVVEMITLKFDRHIGSSAAEVAVKFQSDRTILHTKSHGFETSRDLTLRRVNTWNNPLLPWNPCMKRSLTFWQFIKGHVSLNCIIVKWYIIYILYILYIYYIYIY